MFFFFSKVLALIIQPIYWVIALLSFSFFVKKESNKKRLFLIGSVVFLFFSNSIIFDEFMRPWEIEGKTPEEIGQYDVAIVLGGMLAYNKDLKRISFRDGSDRLWQTIDLYNKGKVKKILITGENGTITNTGLNEAIQLKKFLIQCGFQKKDFITESVSKNTYQNASFTKKVLDQHPELKKKLLVTSASHMRRARATFKKQGVKVDTYTTNHLTGKRYYTFERLFIPQIDALNNWNNLLHELVGYIIYDIVGYI